MPAAQYAAFWQLAENFLFARFLRTKLIVGEPEDLAEAYLYLMRERFSTGAMIVVDGGSTLV
jgi:NAD(P)-dependent dehydrogenase (short-subunit alcohol dehydrogenase family)